MLKENEIRDQLAGYLAGHIPLRELSSWLYEATWDMDADTDPSTQAFAYAVLARLAEHSSAGFSEAELRTGLSKLATNIIIQEHPKIRMGSKARILAQQTIPIAQ